MVGNASPWINMAVLLCGALENQLYLKIKSSIVVVMVLHQQWLKHWLFISTIIIAAIFYKLNGIGVVKKEYQQHYKED